MTIWLILGVIIIAALAIYAGRLLWLLRKQTKAAKQAKKQQQLALQEHDSKVLTSVMLIVQAMQAEQCELSEGCWRLSVLLDSLKTTSGLAAKFPAIFGLYNNIKGMAILEERKKLAKKERMQEDYQRMKLEAEFQDAVMQELTILAEFTDDQMVKKLH